MLVKREAGLALSRVLAGTIRRTGDDDRDLNLAAALAKSSKDLQEHEYAVASVARALAPYCSGMNVPEAPYMLGLPNVLHLATDVTGVAEPGVSSLALAAALHPSAAVCGTPTEPARALIAELEHLDRERYAGPVGWLDAARQRRVGHRPALRADQRDRPAADPAVRRLRHRRRVRPGGRAGRVGGQAGADARRAPRLTVVAVVLAGGESRRFGSDKLAAALDQQTLLDHTLAALPEEFAVIVVGPERPTTRSVRFTREQPPGGGPAAGLVAGVRAALASTRTPSSCCPVMRRPPVTGR